MAKQCDLSVYQGDDYAATVTVFNPDMSPADLTGYTAQAQIRQGPADQAPAVAAVFVCTIIPPDVTSAPNIVSLYLSHDQSALLPGVNYQWDLQLVSPSGMITTILYGDVTLTQEVTREAVA